MCRTQGTEGDLGALRELRQLLWADLQAMGMVHLVLYCKCWPLGACGEEALTMASAAGDTVLHQAGSRRRMPYLQLLPRPAIPTRCGTSASKRRARHSDAEPQRATTRLGAARASCSKLWAILWRGPGGRASSTGLWSSGVDTAVQVSGSGRCHCGRCWVGVGGAFDSRFAATAISLYALCLSQDEKVIGLASTVLISECDWLARWVERSADSEGSG